eukprot:6185066-Pleurochrysis_carterae.AAC.1
MRQDHCFRGRQHLGLGRCVRLALVGEDRHLAREPGRHRRRGARDPNCAGQFDRLVQMKYCFEGPVCLADA